MKRLLVLAALTGLFFFPAARAEAQDDQYVQIYNAIQEADVLNQSRQSSEALPKYIAAQRALENFQRRHPDWNARIVAFRLNYLSSQIAELTAKAPPAAPRPETNAPVSPVLQLQERTELENRLNALQGQVRQLRADNQSLEAKLKEALAAQPSAFDPRELAKAEEKIRALEKENGLLQVSLGQQQAGSSPPAAGKTLEKLNRELAEANQKLADQTARTSALMIEKEALQTKLDGLGTAAEAAVELEATRKALQESNQKLAAQTELASAFSREKETLETRVKTLLTETEVAAALRDENAILKKQLADAKQSSTSGATEESGRRLAEARAQIATLQSDKEMLRLEKAVLENQVKQLSTVPAATPAIVAAVSAKDAGRIRELERERSDLQKKLQATQKELYGRKRRGAAARIEELAGELQVLHTRLAAYEARQVPYSLEELALFNKGQAAPPSASSKPVPVSVKELPAGTATLVAEARRDFASKQYRQAEEKYLQILQKDENNVFTLANLATIQLELGHVDDAEKHIRQAIALKPNDAYSLLVLGQIRFRREQYEEALDALSRAAKLDSGNAEIQNYLGLTLSHKGMRQPAETAFRQALKLDPNYGGAHYNLAVFYISQKPPWPELARWHYRKAVDGGFPRNSDLEKMLEQTGKEGQ